MVIAEPAGVTFGSHVTIYPSKQSHLRQEVRVFPLDKGKIRAPAELLGACARYIMTVLDTNTLLSLLSVQPGAAGACERVSW